MSSQIPVNLDRPFLCITPINRLAYSLVDSALSEAESKLTATGTTYITNDGAGATIATGLSPGDTDDLYFPLYLDETRGPKRPRNGWLFGRNDSEDADVKIAPSSAQGVAPIQFILSIHRQSGVVVLEASSHPENRIEYQREYSADFHKMEPGSTYPLVGPSTVIRFAGCKFSINLVLSGEGCEALSAAFDAFVGRVYGRILHHGARHFCGLENRNRCGSYFLGQILGSGTFGDVYYCVDGASGEPLAMKQVRTINSAGRRGVSTEIDIQRQCASAYVLRVIKAWCKHGVEPSMCLQHGHDITYILTPLGRSDFRELTIGSNSGYSVSEVMTFFKQALMGLSYVHGKGIIHRDVSRANTFVTNILPLRAVVGDFGKAVKGTLFFDTSIGPVSYCAPEVWQNVGYTAAVDVYCWGYMVAEYLGYESPSKERITARRHEQLCGFVQAAAAESGDRDIRPFVDLVLRCLSWAPEDRPTAAEAVTDIVWQRLQKRNALTDDDDDDDEEEKTDEGDEQTNTDAATFRPSKIAKLDCDKTGSDRSSLSTTIPFSI